MAPKPKTLKTPPQKKKKHRRPKAPLKKKGNPSSPKSCSGLGTALETATTAVETKAEPTKDKKGLNMWGLLWGLGFRVWGLGFGV